MTGEPRKFSPSASLAALGVLVGGVIAEACRGGCPGVRQDVNVVLGLVRDGADPIALVGHVHELQAAHETLGDLSYWYPDFVTLLGEVLVRTIQSRYPEGEAPTEMSVPTAEGEPGQLRDASLWLEKMLNAVAAREWELARRAVVLANNESVSHILMGTLLSHLVAEFGPR